MLRLLEIDEHGRRLRDLLSRFRAQELAITSALDHLAAATAAAQEDAWHAAFASDGAHDRHVARCIELQSEVDRLEVELAHVRMAIHGTQEELEAHDHRRFTAARSLAIASPA